MPGQVTRTATQRVDVVHRGEQWIAETGGRQVMSGTRKDDLVRNAAASAPQSGAPTSVRIHGPNDRIQEEGTYGKGADPRRSKG